MKTKEEIRKETPLSVTTTDNPIFAVVEAVECVIFESIIINGEKYTIETDCKALLNVDDRLRLLQCFDDNRPNWYRWSDGSDQIMIPDEYVRYVSGYVENRS